MKKAIMICVALMLAFGWVAASAGGLPDPEIVYGAPMPSLVDTLNRYPDEEHTLVDGSVEEIWYEVSREDYAAFGEYLSSEGCEVLDYTTDGLSLVISIGKGKSGFTLIYDTEAMTGTLIYPEGTYDAKTSEASRAYEQAKELYIDGDFEGAYKLLRTIRGYRDVDETLLNDECFAALLDAEVAVGDYVVFGSYPQTASGTDDTPIEWLVLAVDGNKALLLSRYGLDAQPYNKEWVDITWEKCTLRAWLNDTFINEAFTEDERECILTTDVDNSASQGYGEWNTIGGNNTQDKIFLLSYAEANKYLGVTYDDRNNTKSRVAPTAYAVKQGAFTTDYKTVDGDKAGWWWLRSPGHDQDDAAIVDYGGFFRDYHLSVYFDDVSVRPAVWINLDSGIF